MPYWSDPEKRDKERMEKGREGLRKRDFPFLEKLLAGAGGYLCGAFSLADTAMMPVAMVLDVDPMSLEAFPRLNGYLARLRERPSYRAISPRTKVADASQRG